MVRKFQKVQWYLIQLDILTQFSRKFQVRIVASRLQSFFLKLSQINRLNQISRFGFSHQRVNRKLYNCREGIDWEVFNLIHVSKFWCPRTHWRLCFFNHVGFQNHVSTLVEARNFPSRSQSKNISFEQTFRLKRCRFSSLQQKPDDPKVPKVSMNFGLSLFSNSFFSESSSSNCSIKTSIDFFGVVTNQSIKSNQLVWFLPSTCQSKAL